MPRTMKILLCGTGPISEERLKRLPDILESECRRESAGVALLPAMEAARFDSLTRPVLVGLALMVKIVPALLFVLRGVGLRRSLNAGVLLSSRLSLIIVAASIGLQAGFISEAFKDSIVLLAVITCLLGPSLFKVLHGSETRGGPPAESGRGMEAPWAGM